MRNKKGARVTRQDASFAVAQLMPQIIRGVQLDFFVQRGVTQTQFLVITVIHADGRCSMGALARSLQTSRPTISGIVDRLVRSGHVRRLSPPTDRRQVLVELTPRGRAFVRGFQQIIRRRWEDVLQSLTQSELEAFHHVLTSLRQRLGARA